jgi:hypothetical protein
VSEGRNLVSDLDYVPAVISDRPTYDLDDWPTCPVCHAPLEHSDCDLCGGEGEHDAYEEDPLWYSPGDTEPCPQCGGEGGWWVCPNAPHTEEGVKA